MLDVISLTNAQGVELVISNFGATIGALRVPDKNRKPVNVVVGLQAPEDYTKTPYLDHDPFLGCTVGRYAGRISGGSFIIEGKKYSLHTTKGVHLHGGKEGFDKKFWTIDKLIRNENQSVQFSYRSEHLEENYPGNLQVKALYELLENNAVRITYTATTDRPTVVNLTNHSYFNLDGEGSILDNDLQIHSDAYLEVNEQLLPSGEKRSTKSTRFDFNQPQTLEKNFKGLDDTFVLKKSYDCVASLYSKHSGIRMNVTTNQPAMVVFTPEYLPPLDYVDNAKYGRYPAICFETQNYPDAPNQPNFPSALLLPGETYQNQTIFEFFVSDK